jgi:hypothetical protein
MEDGDGDESGVTNTRTLCKLPRRFSDMSHNGHPEPEVIVNVGDIALYS